MSAEIELNSEDLSDLLVSMFMVRQTPHIVGGPGIGKTSLIYQTCNRLSQILQEQVSLMVLHLSTMDEVDIAGIRIPSKLGNDLITQTTMSPLVPYGNARTKYGIVFLDEMMQADHSVLKPTARFVEEYRIGDWALPDNWWIVCASNRAKDRSGVSKPLMFMQNRISQVGFAVNVDCWVNWAYKANIHPFIIAFAKFKPGDVFVNEVPLEDGPFCSPRTLVKSGSLMVARADKKEKTGLALDDITMAGVAGFISQGTMAHLHAFVRKADRLPTFEDIVEKPKEVKIPDEIDLQHALVQLMAARVNQKNATPVFEFLARLMPEFQVSGVTACIAREKTVAMNPLFATWVQEHQDLILTARQAA